jgi:hypothetical protein
MWRRGSMTAAVTAREPTSNGAYDDGYSGSLLRRQTLRHPAGIHLREVTFTCNCRSVRETPVTACAAGNPEPVRGTGVSGSEDRVRPRAPVMLKEEQWDTKQLVKQ